MTRSLPVVLAMLACWIHAPAPQLTAQLSPHPGHAAAEALPDGALARLGSLRLQSATDVHELRWSGGGELLVALNATGARQAWSTADGRPRPAPAASPLPAHLAASADDPLQELRALDDGSLALAWSREDGRARLLLGDIERPVELDGREPRDALLAPDGTLAVLLGERIASRSDLATWIVGCTPDGTPRWDVELPGLRLATATWMPAWEGAPASVVIAARDGRLVRLDANDGATLQQWTAHGAAVQCLAAGAAGALVSGDSGGELAAWSCMPSDDTDGGPAPDGGKDGGHPHAPTLRWRSDAHPTAVVALAVDPRGDRVASAGRDRRLQLRRWSDGTTRVQPLTHATRVTALARLPGGDGCVTAGWSGRLGLWSDTGEHRAWIDAHHGRPTGLALFPGTGLALSAGQDGRLALWSLRDGQLAAPVTTVETAVLALDATADGRHLATSLGDGDVHLWKLGPDAEGRPELQRQGRVSAGARTAFSLAYGPGGATLAIGTSAVRLVDAAAGSVRWEVALRAPVGALELTRDGSAVAAGLASRQVVLLASEDGRELARWTGLPGRVSALALSPDGTRIAVAAGDERVRIRAVAGGPVTGLGGHLGEVTTLMWCDDGTLLSGSADGTALLWMP